MEGQLIMARCGWCAGTKINNGRACVCASGKKPYFPGIKAKKKDDTLKSGHKHGMDLFLRSTPTGDWFDCKCGHTHKIAKDW